MDRKQVAKALRTEADQLLKAAMMLEGSGSTVGRPRRQMSEETKAKMKASQQARWAAKKKTGKKAKPKAEAEKQ